MTNPPLDGLHDHPQDDSQGPEPIDWKSLLFPPGKPIATPGVTIAPNGPFGRAALASKHDLDALVARASEQPDDHLRLLNAYAVVHDPNPSVIEAHDLPIPLGKVSPNAIFFGRSGSGKTQKGTLPAAIAAIRHHWSLIYLNVKGRKQTRLLRKVAAAHGRAGEMHLLAPGSPNRTLGCTLLDGCADLTFAREVASCMVAAAARHSRSGEGAWAYNQAEDFLTHAIAAVCTDLPPERRSLSEVRKVVVTGDYEAFVARHPNFPLLRRFANFQNGNRNGETIASTIGEATSFIDGLEPLLATGEFSISAFAARKGILILEIDEPDLETFTPFITLMLGRLIRELQRVACRSATGWLACKTIVVIDELAPMSFIPGLANALHTCRERGFCFVAATQSVAQLQAMHGQATADVLLAGFQSQIAVGGKLDPVTAEHLSRRCGTCTISVPTIVETKGSENTPAISARSWSMVPRALLLPGDIASPTPHPLLGDPLTFILGDTTPPFQAYVLPAHEQGWIARLNDEVDAMETDDDLRLTPLRSTADTDATPCRPTPSPIAETRIDTILMALARTHPSDGNWRWLCNLVKESAAEPEAALHLLQQIQMGTLSLTSLRDAQRLAGILCPRAIVALAHYRRYKSTHLAKRRAEEATPRHANSQSDPLGEPTPHCDRCSGPVEVGQPTCNLCGPPPPPPPPHRDRRPRGDTPPPRPSPKIVIKIDDAALASFPECLPFPQPPTRPKRSGRKRK
jgi:hypothetical protein